MNDEASGVTTTFLLRGFCSDEWVDSRMDYVLVDISTARAEHLLEVMDRVPDLRTLDDRVFRIELWDGSAIGFPYFGPAGLDGLMDPREEGASRDPEAVFTRLVTELVESGGQMRELPGGLPRPVHVTPVRSDVSMLYVCDDYLLWEITPKHTHVRVQSASIDRGVLARLAAKHTCLEGEGEDQRARFQVIARSSPDLAFQVIREEIWRHAAGQTPRLTSLTAEDVVPLLTDAEPGVRERAFRALGEMPGRRSR